MIANCDESQVDNVRDLGLNSVTDAMTADEIGEQKAAVQIGRTENKSFLLEILCPHNRVNDVSFVQVPTKDEQSDRDQIAE